MKNLKALDAMADVVLAYRPKPKTKPARQRKRRAKLQVGSPHWWKKCQLAGHDVSVLDRPEGAPGAEYFCGDCSRSSRLRPRHGDPKGL